MSASEVRARSSLEATDESREAGHVVVYDPRMPVVRLRAPLKRLAGDLSEHVLEGGTVVGLLRELERAHPDLEGWILDERGLIRRHISVFVNGERGDGSTAVEAGDRVEVLPAISGGAP